MCGNRVLYIAQPSNREVDVSEDQTSITAQERRVLQALTDGVDGERHLTKRVLSGAVGFDVDLIVSALLRRQLITAGQFGFYAINTDGSLALSR
jgi:hypothetical protein